MPHSGSDSTYPTVQISGATSEVVSEYGGRSFEPFKTSKQVHSGLPECLQADGFATVDSGCDGLGGEHVFGVFETGRGVR